MDKAQWSSTPRNDRFLRIVASGSGQIIYYSKAEADSMFTLFKFTQDRLQTGQAVKVTGYSVEQFRFRLVLDRTYNNEMDRTCRFVDRNSGVYKTPQKGTYHFTEGFGQAESGRLEMYVCENKTGTRELLGFTKTGEYQCCGGVVFELDEGVGVWVEVLRPEGEAYAIHLKFCGELVLNKV